MAISKISGTDHPDRSDRLAGIITLTTQGTSMIQIGSASSLNKNLRGLRSSNLNLLILRCGRLTLALDLALYACLHGNYRFSNRYCQSSQSIPFDSFGADL